MHFALSEKKANTVQFYAAKIICTLDKIASAWGLKIWQVQVAVLHRFFACFCVNGSFCRHSIFGVGNFWQFQV